MLLHQPRQFSNYDVEIEHMYRILQEQCRWACNSALPPLVEGLVLVLEPPRVSNRIQEHLGATPHTHLQIFPQLRFIPDNEYLKTYNAMSSVT